MRIRNACKLQFIFKRWILTGAVSWCLRIIIWRNWNINFWCLKFSLGLRLHITIWAFPHFHFTSISWSEDLGATWSKLFPPSESPRLLVPKKKIMVINEVVYSKPLPSFKTFPFLTLLGTQPFLLATCLHWLSVFFFNRLASCLTLSLPLLACPISRSEPESETVTEGYFWLMVRAI